MDLLERAATQHHAFTTAQAKAAGYTWRTIAAEIAAGQWLDLGKGVMVAHAAWEGLDRDGQHLCRVSGRLLRKQLGWAAARRSSAIVHGLPLLGFPPERPQLVRDPGSSRSSGHSRHERILPVPAEDLAVIDGIPTTTLLRTWSDLAAEEPFRNAVVVGDAVLRRGVAREELLARASGPSALEAARFADPLAESALESISRVACRVLQLPIPRLQIKVLYAGEEVARVDSLWEDLHTIGQADGALKYKDSSRVMKDKWQDEKLESLGFEVARWGWDDAFRPQLLRGTLTRAFARGRDKRIDPGVRLVQATLAESLRVWRTAA
jgi:hypothetical protein